MDRVIELLESDDEDDMMLLDSKPAFRDSKAQEAKSASTCTRRASAQQQQPSPVVMMRTPMGSVVVSVTLLAAAQQQLGGNNNNHTIEKGTLLQLVRVPDAPHRKSFIAVSALSNTKVPLGFVSPSDSARLAPLMDAAELHRVEISETEFLTDHGTSTGTANIQVFFDAKADRLLSELEMAPMMKFVKMHMGSYRFISNDKKRKLLLAPPPPTELQTPKADSTHTITTTPATVGLTPSPPSSSSSSATTATFTLPVPASTNMPPTPNVAAAAMTAAVAAATSSVNVGFILPSKNSSKHPAEPPEVSSMSVGNDDDDEAEGDIHVELTSVDWKDKNGKLDEMFDDQMINKLATLPRYPMPKQLKVPELYDYQQDGIRWLIHMEANLHLLPPWYTQTNHNNRTMWRCSITETNQLRRPPTLSGGILGDDMGLGKTLQTIGLILSRPPPPLKSYPYKPSTPLQSQTNNNNSGGGRNTTCSPRTTVIVAPLSVLANWKQQINQHVNSHYKKRTILTVQQYHGSSREKVLELVKGNNVDVLLVSYHTLAADLKKYLEWNPPKNSTLPRPTKKRRPTTFIFDLEFHRVILDEAHIIRSPKSGFFRSCKKLNTRRKLCLTGTPYVNRPGDLHSLLSFLNVHPLATAKVFKDRVVTPISESRECGLAVVRTTLAHVCLRRSKELVRDKIRMAEKKVHHILIKFVQDSPHQKIHDDMYMACRMCFEGMLRQYGDEALAGSSFMRVVTMVLRVRQACCHSALVPEEILDGAYNMLAMVKEKSKEELSNIDAMDLLAKLNGVFEDNVRDECAVCMEVLEPEQTAILKSCSHVFCTTCLHKITNNLCPMCRQTYTSDDIVSKQRAEKAVVAKKMRKQVNHAARSPKVQALLNTIGRMAPDEKGVIFSQWTSFLDIIQQALETNGYTYTRIDGTMDMSERCHAMELFGTEKCNSFQTPRFILCSMHACGTGINLTRGNVVFLMDCWWNVAAENQAMDRVHRIGQKRNVRVYRMLMKDSMEERMVNLQDAKAAVGKGAIEKLDPHEKRRARLTALKDLFEIGNVETEWKDY